MGLLLRSRDHGIEAVQSAQASRQLAELTLTNALAFEPGVVFALGFGVFLFGD